jgi:hypothetical protein
MLKTKRRYPSLHGPGSSPATSMAWAILDHAPPGMLSDYYRFLLGGMIAGAVSEVYRLGRAGEPISAIEEHAKKVKPP